MDSVSCFMKLDIINVQLVVCEIKIDLIDICDVEVFIDLIYFIFQIVIKEQDCFFQFFQMIYVVMFGIYFKGCKIVKV